MPYGLKYTANTISKNGKTYTLLVYERDYVGSQIGWQLGTPAFVKNLIAQSDNVTEPYLAKELQVTLLQGETYNLPDVQTFDDRKYFATLNEDGQIVFYGFLINDSIQLPFTTGLQYINLSFTDGIGLLKNIEFVPNSYDTSATMSLLDVALSCLNAIDYDATVRLNVATSIFASGMNDRGDGTQYEPLSQCYLPIRDFLKTDGTYVSCYEALEAILKAFEAQLIQSNGEWWIVSQYERDATQIYFTKYNPNGGIVSSGLSTIGVTVNTDPYFIDNEQYKILKKGFNKVTLTNPNQYAVNMLSNPNLIIGDGTQADYWTIDTATYTTYIQPGPANLPYYRTDMTAVIAPNTFSGVFSDTNFNVNVGDKITFSMFMTGGGGAATTLPDAIAQIIVDDGTDLYYWATNNDKENAWVKNAGGNDVYYQIPAQSTLNGTTVNIATTGCPVSGLVTVGVYLKTAVTNVLAEFGQFSATVESYYGEYKTISSLGAVGTLSGSTITLATPYTFIEGKKLKLIVRDMPIENAIYVDLISQSGLTLNLASAPNTGYTVFIVTQDFQYETENEIKIGTSGVSLSLQGVLLDSAGNAWGGWYRYGVTEAYGSLFDLLNIIYANQLAYNQINVDGRIYGVKPEISSFEFTDPTNGYDITGKRYILGNTSTDYIDNTTKATFLEVNSTDVTVARYNIYNQRK
jgi:hypothetical protein